MARILHRLSMLHWWVMWEALIMFPLIMRVGDIIIMEVHARVIILSVNWMEMICFLKC